MSSKLHQIVAVESSEKKRLERTRTELYKKLQKEALFTGMVRKYEPKDEEGEQLPDEVARVQMTVQDAVEDFQEATVRLIDLTASKDYGNVKASSDIVVEGETLVHDCPVSLLLFLEKQFEDLETFVRHAPVLGTDREWTPSSSNEKIFVSNPEHRNSTKKVQRAIVLYDATPEHPAQTQLITEDVIQGVWTAIQQHGGITQNQKRAWTEKIAKLRIAVKEARCNANETEVETKKIGDKLFNFVFGQ